ncbi:hypothetical protein [Burkholderia phage BCSR129]|nr:hypothetical protein [Burkholderia phage BCSR129]
MAARLTTAEVVEKFRNKHGNKYGYSKVNYSKYELPVTIICPVHGEFEQTPKNHLSSCGCPRCGKAIQNEAAANTLARKPVVVTARALALNTIFGAA